MRLLLDTHILLWSSYRPQRLSSVAKQVLESNAENLCFSSVSFVELAIKQQTGKLDLHVDLSELRLTLTSMNTPELPFASDHAFALATLPLLHRDPFDRMLVSQAIVLDFELLTADKLLLQYPAKIRYVG